LIIRLESPFPTQQGLRHPKGGFRQKLFMESPFPTQQGLRPKSA